MTKNILLSLMASFGLVLAFALPVQAAEHDGHHVAANDGAKHHATAATHDGHHATAAAHDKHPATALHGHTIKSELEARANAPHDQHNRVMYRVKTTTLNERSGPGEHYHKVGTLKQGTLVEVKELSENGKWALVHTGTWVYTKHLEKNGEKHQGMNHLGEPHAKAGTHHTTHATHGEHAKHAIG